MQSVRTGSRRKIIPEKMNTMTKRYQTLQKKLKELKAELRFVLSSIPPGKINDSDALNHEFLSSDIQRRFLFVNNLLAAEMASQNPSKSRRLRRMAKTLAHLESVFREWEDHSRIDHGGVDNNNFGDAVSVCSCDDDDDDDDSCPELEVADSSSVYGGVEENLNNSPERLVDVSVEHDVVLEKAAGGGGCGDEDKGAVVVFGLKKRREGNGGGGGYCGGLITGLVFGAVLMSSIMIRICSRCYLTVEEAFLFPT